MPTVAVDSQSLFKVLGADLGIHGYVEAEFTKHLEAVCFQFGLEYDGSETNEGRTKLRIEVPANRYDLLCFEGIADALKTFLSCPTPPFRTFKHSRAPTSDWSPTVIQVGRGLEGIRPYCLGAIFRNVRLDQDSFASFIDLQDKLHQNIGRRRSLLAIGSHNLDSIEPPFTYQALPRRGGFRFVPLNRTEEVDGDGMFDLLQKSYLAPYLSLISDHEEVPVFMDSKSRVLSVPPIINADFCKISHNTRNIFVEITAHDLNKAQIALDVITSFMADKMPDLRSVEPLNVKYEKPISFNGESISAMLVPSLETTQFKVSVEYCRRVIGVETLSGEDILRLLPKMGLSASLDSDNEDLVNVICPITRRDILHQCDIVEDIAIAYGYNNIESRTFRAVSLQSVQNLSERIRRCASVSGWRECLTFGLISLRECFADLRRIQPGSPTRDEFYSLVSAPAIVSAPKSRDFECVRSTLIPGLLKTLVSNQASELPIKLFEIGDCVSLSPDDDNQTKQRRQFAAVVADHNRAGLEDVHGLLDVVLKELKLVAAYSALADRGRRQYELNELEDGAFFPGRCVAIDVFANELSSGEEDVVADRIRIGVMGVVHPEVLFNFGIPFPCSLFEISIEPFLSWLDATAQSAP